MTALLIATALTCLEPAAVLGLLEGRASSLSTLLGPQKPLVETAGEQFAVAWPDASRAVVLLRPKPVLVTLNAAICTADSRIREDRFGAVRVFQVSDAPLAGAQIKEVDTAGVRIGSRVVLFPAGNDHPRTVSLYIEGGSSLQYLLTGMAGGTWDLWRDGWLVDPDLPAGPGGTLAFEGPPGSYFIRKR